MEPDPNPTIPDVLDGPPLRYERWGRAAAHGEGPGLGGERSYGGEH